MKIKDLAKIERPREKLIAKRIKKICVCCSREIKVILYKDKTYRGGHYFFDLPIKNGAKAEYWECPKCYWKIK